jgi:glycosyltransferase involved in cell wall biosynthesis
MLLACAGALCLCKLPLALISVVPPVVIDISRLLGRYFDGRYPTGVDRVTLAYVQHYQTSARAMLRWRGRSGLFSKAISVQVFALLSRWDAAEAGMLRRLILRGVFSSIGTGNGCGALLLHTGHNDAESPALWRNIRWHNLRPVFFVHDLIPLTHPQYCRAGEYERHEQRLRHMLRGVAVVANSNQTLLQLAEYARNNDLLMPQNTVALLAPPAPFTASFITKSSTNLGKLGQNYFVVVGTIEPRKNHALLLAVWRDLLSTLELDHVPHLVVIGQSGWDCEALEAQLGDTHSFNDRVHWIKQCSDTDMLTWLQHARALLFPSFVEGFGMPLAEALSLGTPVIASDLAVFREFSGEVPHYLPSTNVLEWSRAVINYAQTSSGERVAQCKRIERWHLPTWEEHFTKVDTLLETLSAPASCDAAKRLSKAVLPSSSGLASAQGFSWRKARILQRYLVAMGVSQQSGAAFAWGAAASSQDVVRVEDGFIRSVGLGADLVVPLSWVFDTRGMYFDASAPSDLEWLIEHKDYSSEELARAAALRQQVVDLGVTKYNLVAPVWHRPKGHTKVLLVAGQVESDASIRLGAYAVRTNLQLLTAVRERNPDAYIVYKPHPDVVAGLRAGQTQASAVHALANEVIVHADMAQLLHEVDGVHVITSLTGFEALLRGVPVTVYGAPFYAGWGLCIEVDLPESVAARRTRRASLNHLVAAALVDYPVYLHPQLKSLMTAEQAVQLLKAQRTESKGVLGSYILRPLLTTIAKWNKRF